MLQSLQRMSRMMHNLQNSVNVQSQVFRVLLAIDAEASTKKERKVANTAELSKCCRSNTC